MSDEIIKPKHPGGCPKGSKHKDRFELDEQRQNLAARSYALGLKLGQVAQILGVTEFTLRRRFQEQPEFYAKMKQARAEKILDIAENVYEMAISKEHSSITFNAAELFLKTQAGWHEAKPIPIENATTFQKVDMLQDSLNHIQNKIFDETDFQQLTESLAQDVDGED